MMLVVNSVMFVLWLIYPPLTSILGLTPARFFSDFPNLIYQVFTYMFMHAGFGHILFNMFALWMFGSEVEQTWGSARFGRFYILAGLAGAALTLIVRSGQAIPMVGASAAIYGVLVAYWLMFPHRMLYIYFMFPIKVKYAIPGMMILGFLFGGPYVAHWAHAGGALFGLIYTRVDWSMLRLGNWFRRVKYERQEAKLQKNRQKAEDTMKRVDEILDKINEVGFENLTRAERQFLEDASSKLSNKKANDQR